MEQTVACFCSMWQNCSSCSYGWSSD